MSLFEGNTTHKIFRKTNDLRRKALASPLNYESVELKALNVVGTHVVTNPETQGERHIRNRSHPSTVLVKG